MGLRPFGLALSGGLDSTIILHELRESGRVRTYTTRFEGAAGQYNTDADLAQRLAGEYSIDHHEVLVTPSLVAQSYERSVARVEEPSYNPSYAAYDALMRAASTENTIMLGGDGGDEVFLGYQRFQDAKNIARRLRQFSEFPSVPNAWYAMHRAKSGRGSASCVDLRDPVSLWLQVNHLGGNIAGLLRAGGTSFAGIISTLKDVPIDPSRFPVRGDLCLSLAALDRCLRMPSDDLLRGDKIAMGHGVEGRFPMLSREIECGLASVSSEVLLAHGPKSMLRSAYRGQLPGYIIDKPKTGWNIPIPDWVDGPFGMLMREMLSSGYHRESAELFDLPGALALLEKGRALSLTESRAVTLIMNIRAWMKAFSVRIDSGV
jgi:asparagine synthase (glutamine-hydrolysing)